MRKSFSASPDPTNWTEPAIYHCTAWCIKPGCIFPQDPASPCRFSIVGGHCCHSYPSITQHSAAVLQLGPVQPRAFCVLKAHGCCGCTGISKGRDWIHVRLCLFLVPSGKTWVNWVCAEECKGLGGKNNPIFGLLIGRECRVHKYFLITIWVDGL